MKILYGIQGTGNGHLTRARALAPALREAGADLDFVLSGRPRDQFFNMDAFGNDWRCFKGLTFATRDGRLLPGKTVFNSDLIQFVNDVIKLDVTRYDVVISDFEPVTAWACKLKGVQSLGISHQSAFLYCVPKVSGHISSRFLMRFFAPTNHPLGLHWHHFDQDILPPLIEPQTALASKPDKIVVYMGFETVDAIINFVSPFTDYQFHIYARVSEKRKLGHITINPLSHKEFHNDLCDAGGVISNAGFELASECIQLGKKILIKPLSGQFEQLCNALAMQSMKRGTVIESLDQNVLKQWLEMPGHKPSNYPDVPGAIAQWIMEKDWSNTHALAKQLWDKTGIKCAYNNQFGKKLQPGLID